MHWKSPYAPGHGADGDWSTALHGLLRPGTTGSGTTGCTGNGLSGLNGGDGEGTGTAVSFSPGPLHRVPSGHWKHWPPARGKAARAGTE